jgi:hypothetical protein
MTANDIFGIRDADHLHCARSLRRKRAHSEIRKHCFVGWQSNGRSRHERALDIRHTEQAGGSNWPNAHAGRAIVVRNPAPNIPTGTDEILVRARIR